MREYELTVVFDLSVMEAGGPDASVEQLKTIVEARGGRLLRADHWGRRRMAYPIGRAIDGDYVVSRVELEPAAVAPLESVLNINEKVYRHLVVRADELPVPLPPREPRPQPGPVAEGPVEAEAEASAVEAPAAEAAAEAPSADSLAEEAAIPPAAEPPASAEDTPRAAPGDTMGAAEQTGD